MKENVSIMLWLSAILLYSYRIALVCNICNIWSSTPLCTRALNLLWARCVTVPPTWGHRTPLAAQSKVGSESALGCASTFQREWRGAVGTAGLGYWTHDSDGSLPFAQLDRPFPWAIPRRATSIHTYIWIYSGTLSSDKEWQKSSIIKSGIALNLSCTCTVNL